MKASQPGQPAAQEQQASRWKIDKTVPLPMLLTVMILGVSGFWFVAEIKKDVELLKAGQLVQRERDIRQDLDLAAAMGANRNETLFLRSDIKDLSQKLDRLIESQRSKR